MSHVWWIFSEEQSGHQGVKTSLREFGTFQNVLN